MLGVHPTQQGTSKIRGESLTLIDPSANGEAALCRCPGAPSGIVMVEMRSGQVQAIELEPFVASDPWHACAAKRLRRLQDGQHAFHL